MYNADDILKMIKRAAIEAINASKPSDVLFGTVLSSAPLQIQLEQKLILTASSLILTRNVTNYVVTMEVDHETEETSGGTGQESFEKHKHKVKGDKLFTVKNGLVPGEKVVLMRASGGQKYVVIDRIGGVG